MGYLSEKAAFLREDSAGDTQPGLQGAYHSRGQVIPWLSNCSEFCTSICSSQHFLHVLYVSS